jgi:hypothetical protein
MKEDVEKIEVGKLEGGEKKGQGVDEESEWERKKRRGEVDRLKEKEGG